MGGGVFCSCRVFKSGLKSGLKCWLQQAVIYLEFLGPFVLRKQHWKKRKSEINRQKSMRQHKYSPVTWMCCRPPVWQFPPRQLQGTAAVRPTGKIWNWRPEILLHTRKCTWENDQQAPNDSINWSLGDKLLLKWSYNLTLIIIPFTALMIGPAAASASDVSIPSPPFPPRGALLLHIVAATPGKSSQTNNY